MLFTSCHYSGGAVVCYLHHVITVGAQWYVIYIMSLQWGRSGMLFTSCHYSGGAVVCYLHHVITVGAQSLERRTRDRSRGLGFESW